jgi:hypothetical protein
MRRQEISVAFGFALVLSGVVACMIGSAPRAHAVPSYARQTGLPCSGCHYAPPELNPAGRRFKLLGYVDRADDTKTIKDGATKRHAGLDLLSALPLSVMFDASLTSLKTPQPGTQNGGFEFPQDISLFLAGAWTTHIGSFVQATYDTQDDHLTSDNTDIRYANKTKFRSKELIYGVTLNNNPTVEDLWNDTPAWGFPWIASDSAPTPNAAPLVDGNLAQDVAGLGGYVMFDNHLYVDGSIYRSEHVGGPQPNPGTNFTYNIRGVAPYWRLAWQGSTATTQYEVGTYGMHMKSSPGAISGLEDGYTDYAVDFQVDQTLFRQDVLSLRGTYIRENSTLVASFGADTAQQINHHMNTAMANAEYHFGNRISATLGWFTTDGTPDPLLYPQAAVTGNANGDPRSAGFLPSISVWPIQNLQLGLQYTAYTRFNGAGTNYDGAGRNASGNDTLYLLARFLF